MPGGPPKATTSLLLGRIVFVGAFLLGAPLLAGVWNWLGAGYLSIGDSFSW